ncbi:aminoacyl-tRNA hydrolase [Clostridium sp. BJN0001]|uniref:aminoacyl-tRNA hydrolase n=1 Tax=Clostridium sp. BJN0001 TaxID=2930219 RepID=UPI001FD409E2|nr:aminoacyl-tRNA hydrolase [Clostridium sp. BJN0001]
MFLIVGLGNIGKEYEGTRHNVGFRVIDNIASKYDIDINKKKFKGTYGEGFIENEKVILLKPDTFMNLSGESVKEVQSFYKIDCENIIVIHDDISLPLGRIRIRGKGSAGGHNGIKNIIQNLGTDVFPRIKVGVGQPNVDLVHYVLGKFSKDEVEILSKSSDVCVLSAAEIIKNNITEAMNKYNGFNANLE